MECYARRERVVLIVDEAQTLSPALLEEVRLLTNLETPKAKLLQVILLGQPELDATLARNEFRQLKQRISLRFNLKPLNRQDTAEYIIRRLKAAGAGTAISSATMPSRKFTGIRRASPVSSTSSATTP